MEMNCLLLRCEKLKTGIELVIFSVHNGSMDNEGLLAKSIGEAPESVSR